MLQLLKQKWNYAAIVIYLLFASVGIVYFSIAVSNITFGLAVFVFLIGLLKHKIKLNQKTVTKQYYLLIIIPFLLTVISALLSDNVSKGFEYVWLRLPVFITPFIILFVPYTEKCIKQGLKLFVILSLLASCWALYYAMEWYIRDKVFLNPDFVKFITPIQHPYFGVFLLVALTILIKYKLFKNVLIARISIVILLLGILITTSRMVYLLTILFIAVEFGKQFSLKNKILLASTMLFALVVLINTNEKLHNKVYNTFDYWKSPRIWVWENSYKVFRNSKQPILGIGIGDYFNKKQQLIHFKRTETGVVGYSTHNQYIEFILTNGLLGFLFVGIMVYLFFRVTPKKRIIFIIVALFAFTESILSRQYGVQLYALFVPIALYKDKIIS